MPSGGNKDSGIGKEGPRYAIEELTELRTAILHLDQRSPFWFSSTATRLKGRKPVQLSIEWFHSANDMFYVLNN